jgi:hypothetical protein
MKPQLIYRNTYGGEVTITLDLVHGNGFYAELQLIDSPWLHRTGVILLAHRELDALNWEEAFAETQEFWGHATAEGRASR